MMHKQKLISNPAIFTLLPGKSQANNELSIH